MKYLFLLISSFLIINISADETPNEEFKYIQPISVEKYKRPINTNVEDEDNDGVIDSEDNCPNTPEEIKVDNFGCKLFDDDDNDGVSNRDDECPNTKAGLRINETGCAPDTDGDGVIDDVDECENTSGDFVVDNVGCPQTAVLKVNFKSGNDTMLEDSIQNIEIFAEFLNDNVGYQAIIYGYTDSLNNTGNNKKLSQKRANAVMEALLEYGVKLTRLTAIGMGSKNPIADNETAEGRAKNRRIEVELLQ